MANDLSYQELLRGLEGLRVRSVLSSANGWLVEADGPKSAICPHCARPSRSRHSSYRRRLRDLPLRGVSVTLDLRVGRWRCRTPQCQRRIFTERLPGVLEPYARQTKLLPETRTVVSRALGGRPGARLLWRLGMPVSRHTLLRQLKRAAARHSSPPTVRVLGVDDWAWKKGMSFGTILVDLERNEVVDVLPTRSAEVLSVWLSQHPGVEILGRDRQGEYAEGARQGAPDAVQVADRFHLQLNLRQAVERALAVQRQHLRLPAASVTPPATSTPALAEEGPKLRPMRVRSHVCQQEAEAARQRRQQQLELFETVREMKAAGLYVNRRNNR
jgi:transposase